MIKLEVGDLGLAARMGMAPFRATRIEVYTEFQIDYNRTRLVVGWYLGSTYFPCTIYIDRDEVEENPELHFLKIFHRVFNYYRFEIDTIPMYIEDTPTHPHIILGEY